LKNLIHIIPTLQNVGAETVLARIVEEFSKNNVEQIVFTLTGSTSDFHYDSIKKHCRILDWKRNSKSIEALLIEQSNSPILAWMYPAIFFAHKLKKRLRTKHPIIWNIRHSSFRWNQLYQKLALFGFGLYSRLTTPKIIYCSYRSQQVHEKYFFSKKKRTVIQNRLAKKINLTIPKDQYSGNPFLLYVGRYNLAKGPDRLIDIALKYFKKNNTSKLIIAGGGWNKKQIPNVIKDKVQLEGDVSNIEELYQKASALLFTSYSEGYPNVLVEAAVSGLPIIGFEAGDSKYILDRYSLGYSVSSKKMFLDKLQEIENQPPTLDYRKKAAQDQEIKMNFKETVKEYLHFLFN
jgi:glycosyltransferase involved in cell wall biosynthesis